MLMEQRKGAAVNPMLGTSGVARHICGLFRDAGPQHMPDQAPSMTPSLLAVEVITTTTYKHETILKCECFHEMKSAA